MPQSGHRLTPGRNSSRHSGQRIMSAMGAEHNGRVVDFKVGTTPPTSWIAGDGERRPDPSRTAFAELCIICIMHAAIWGRDPERAALPGSAAGYLFSRVTLGGGSAAS